MTHKKLPKSPAIAMRKAPKQRRAINMVEAILEAAAHILEDGKQPFTTNHIAKRAGVSIGSLYQYFPGADSIMATMIEKHVADERAAADAILMVPKGKEKDIMRDLLIAYVNTHADAPRLTARLHALAPVFGLQDSLSNARNAQAVRIAQAIGLPEADVLMSVMAVEGIVLATLVNNPDQLKSTSFLDKLYAILLAPVSSG